MTTQMKLLTIDTATTGCWWYRTKIPFDALKRRGHDYYQASGKGNPLNLKLYDLLCTARAYQGNIQEIVMTAKTNGIKVVFDTDDAIDLVQPENTVYEAIMLMLPSYYSLLRLADLVTCTTPRLAEHLRKFTSSPIEILPNCIDPELWNDTVHVKERKKNVKVRVGLSGSNSHILDVIPLLEAVAQLQKYLDFEFVIFGFATGTSVADWINKNRAALVNRTDHPFLKALERFDKSWQKCKQVRFEPLVSIEYYYHRLMEMNFDIGVCPLEQTVFNDLKSCIKFYEYAKAGVVTLASRVPPYSDEMQDDWTCEHTVEGWKKSLEELITNEQLRQARLKKQQEWVNINRDLEKITDQREEAFLKVLGGDKNADD
ncbi:MAG: hypothetical protein M1275_02500 [Patescibacteria group bacterium]|nr:hypothetical protein [Patescibacteria group bacterium]